MKGPPEESKSGRWKLGQKFSPPTGKHDGHVVEVINPEVELVKRGMIRKGLTVRRVEAKVLCVLVRCLNCLESYSFPEELEIPEGGLVDE